MTTVDFVASGFMRNSMVERINSITFVSNQTFGCSNQSCLCTVRDYSPNVVTPDFRSGHSMVYFSGALYIFGGVRQTGAFLSDLWKFDLSTNIWTRMTPSGIFPRARSEHAMFVFNSKIYVLGGFGGSYRNDLIVYDPIVNSWAVVATTGSFSTRSGFAYGLVGSVLYVIGGRGGTNNSSLRNDVRALNMNTFVWTTVLTNAFGVSSGAFRLSGVVSGNRIYIYGGATYLSGSNNLVYTNSLRYYDVLNSVLITLPVIGAVPGNRAAYIIAFFGSIIYLYGGRDATISYNTLHLYDIGSSTWSSNPMTFSYSRCLSAFAQNGSNLYIDDGALSFSASTNLSELWTMDLSLFLSSQISTKRVYVNASSFIYLGVTFRVLDIAGKIGIRITIPSTFTNPSSSLSLKGLRIIF
jgi:hypothetical protein